MGSIAGLDSREAGGAVAAVAFARLSCASSLDDMQKEIAPLLSQPWVEHVNRRDYEGGWNVLPLRSRHEYLEAHPVLQGYSIQGEGEWRDLPVLRECPAIGVLLASLRCPLKAARLMRLCAGAYIKPHRDHGLALEYGEARLHLPIHSGGDVRFTVDGRLVPMREGELWYVNTDREHEVRNPGNTDRIHLVIDCLADDWLREQFYAADVAFCCREHAQ
jgi:hypothetical protein